MNRKLLIALIIVAALAPLLPDTALAAGDKVVPQVVNGAGSDGVRYRTKFNVINIGPLVETRITKVKLLFYKQDGTPWFVGTNFGTGSEFTLDLGAFQSQTIETQGTGGITVGYAILRNLEATTIYPEDYEVGLSVYYEVSNAGGVIDAISVPIGQPTVSWIFPVDTSVSQNQLTGFAIVNLSTVSNKVTLMTFQGTTPSSTAATKSGEVSFTLAPGEHQAKYLYQSGLFPGQTEFKGMLLGGSERAVAVLALLQTPTPGGLQYSILSPTYQDALRKNTYVYLREGWPLDADLAVVDFYRNTEDTAPWDVVYETLSSTNRQITPISGGSIVALGQRTETQFDVDVSIEYLRGLTYSTTPINLGNGSTNLAVGFTFAIKTGLGRFVKVRIGDIISSGTYRDLALELYAYK